MIYSGKNAFELPQRKSELASSPRGPVSFPIISSVLDWGVGGGGGGLNSLSEQQGFLELND